MNTVARKFTHRIISVVITVLFVLPLSLRADDKKDTATQADVTQVKLSATTEKTKTKPVVVSAEEQKAVLESTDELSTPAGQLTIGGFGGEDDVAEGAGDVLLPLFYDSKGGMLFLNPRASANNDHEQEFNLGLGYRYMAQEHDFIVGGNIYYDSRWTELNNQFDQLGVGLEFMSEYFDARVNYYLPENKKVLTGTHEETIKTSDRTSVSYNTYAQNHEIIEEQQVKRTQTFRHDSYSFYDTTYRGYDLEVGTKVPYISNYLETRVFAGYYNFEPHWEGNVETTGTIDGFKGRLEMRAFKGLFLDATIYEDDKLMGSQWTAGARLILSFDLALLGEGKNPFSSTGDKHKTDKRDALRNRIVENVIRDPHIQLREQRHQVTTTSKSSSTKNYTTTLHDDVIFVNNANSKDPNQDGSKDHPFETINLGLDVTSQTKHDTIYVYAGIGPYKENLRIDHNLRLLGEGQRIGRGAGFGGTKAPRIVGSSGGMIVRPSTLQVPPDNLNSGSGVITVLGNLYNGCDSISVNTMPRGGADIFTLQGFDISVEQPLDLRETAVAPPKLNSDITLVNLVNVENATIAYNTIHGASVGVASSMSGERSFLDIYNNAFNNLGLAAMINSSAENTTLRFRNNIVRDTAIGLVAVGHGNGTQLSAQIDNNIFLGGGGNQYMESYFQSMAGFLPDMGDLLSGLGGLSQNTAGLSVNGNMAINDTSMYNPAISSALLLGIDGAVVNAKIRNNFISGQALGIVGAAIGEDTELNIAVVNNLIRNGEAVGGLLSLIPYMFDSILPSAAFMPATPESDMGLGGILLLAADDATLNTYIGGNNVSDTLLGVTTLSILGADITGEIENNNLNQNLLGITGVSALGASSSFMISDNSILGGGTEVIGDILGGEVSDTGLAGVTLVAYDSQMDAIVSGNTVNDHLLGVSAVAIDNSEMQLAVLDNNIRGKGTELVLSLADALGGVIPPELPPVYAIRDEGISGITVAAIDADIELAVEDNTITDNALGVTVVAADGAEISGADGNSASITGNNITDATIGITSITIGGSDADLYIAENNINNNNVQPTEIGALIGDELSDYFSILPPPAMSPLHIPTPIPTETPIGILAISDDADDVDVEISNNSLTGNAVGVIVSGEDNSTDMEVLIKDNVSDADFYSTGNSINTVFEGNIGAATYNLP